MLKNYLIISLRNIRKNKWYAAINVFGLSIGIAFSLLILLFLQDEFSFDKFHLHKDDIYRVEIMPNGNMESRSSRTPWPMSVALKQEIPHITQATRYDSQPCFLEYQEKSFEEEVFYVDQDFVKMFTLEFVRGTPSSALDDPHKVLISTFLAHKYFGEQNPVGETLTLDDQSFTVSGVFKDFPANSSLHGQIFTRFENHPGTGGKSDGWDSQSIPVFVQLSPSVKPAQLSEPLDGFAKNHLDYNEAKNFKQVVHLTPLTDIHFDHTMKWHKVSNILYSYILGGLALLIVGIACINYVLLALANTTSRSKEVGVRKVLGATRSHIRWQFWGESQIIIFIAFLIALILTQLALPAFNDFTGKVLSLKAFADWKLLIGILGLIFFTALLAGGYPALVLSGILPQKILKGNASQKYKTAFGNYLITFQFTACLSLMIGVMVMFAQMRYIQTKDLGFDQEQIVLISTANSAEVKSEVVLERYRNLLNNDKGILQVSAMYGNIGTFRMSVEPDSVPLNFTMVDHNFFQTLDAELIEGSFFSSTSTNDHMLYVINESMAKRIEQKPVIGAPLDLSMDGKIIGVVKDFHFESLETQIMPMVFIKGKDQFDKILVKISPDNIPQTLEKLEKTWQTAVGDDLFSYTFLNEQLNTQYSSYQRWMKIILYATIFGVAIACLGLLGLTGMIAVNRTREIGIRKVLGASVSGILMLLSKGYLKLMLIAFVVAAPFANYFITEWLQNFAYKIDISWWMFALPGILILLIVLFTVGGQSLKTARQNPVESLRNE